MYKRAELNGNFDSDNNHGGALIGRMAALSLGVLGGMGAILSITGTLLCTMLSLGALRSTLKPPISLSTTAPPRAANLLCCCLLQHVV